MSSWRARVGKALVRWYVSCHHLLRPGRPVLSGLPAATLVPLRRNGLDPIPKLTAQPAVSRLPAPFGIRAFLITGYAEAKQVLADTHTFSTDFRNILGEHNAAGPGGLGFTDPPDHTRLRRLLTPEFTVRRLRRMDAQIHGIVQSRLDAIARAPQPVDLVTEFALPIPSLVICELLGVPYDNHDEFQRLAMQRFDLLGGTAPVLNAIDESLAYLENLVRAQRKEPGDGLLGMVLREHGDDVTDQELAGLADGVLTGGFETTASMLALGAIVLLRDAETFARIRDSDEAVDGFVEELLRYLSVVQVAFPRFARRRLELDGETIEPGDVVIVSLSGANRDAAVAAHVAFGHGAHRCLGAELARMELRAAYPALVRRFPRLRLAIPDGELAYRQASIVYGVDSLPVFH